MKGFRGAFCQGLTDEHFLELDLGALEKPQQITLFLTGWIFPTDTSINIGISQNPALRAPRPPAVYVPDNDGQWKEVMPYMGFPGGKTKTIAVDLSRAFLCDDYRLRIVTSHQIYWDEAFFTVDEEPAPLKIKRLDVNAAHLHYRGFSQPLPQRENHPQTYDYDVVSTTPKWPPMQGRFTRFGNVTELIQTQDDRLVVMGAGDEMTLRFAAPADPPPGWSRDFVLYNVGWDKDADLNTIYGQTSEPLPFVEMKSYPYGPKQLYPDSPQQRAYLKKYQTRRQNAVDFWRMLSR